MSESDTERILRRIREAGYAVEAGTAGYMIRMVATDAHGKRHEVTERDEHTAAVRLAQQVDVELDADD